MKTENKKKNLITAGNSELKDKMSTEGGGEQSSKLVSKLIRDSIENNASDMLFQISGNDARVRIRVDGVLRTVETFDMKKHQKICDCIKEMAGMDLNEKRKPQDGRILLSLAKKDVNLHVSSVPCIFGENIHLKMLSNESVCLDLEKSGMSEEQIETVRKWYNKPNGVILVTGPVGSGKTTVLYMILKELNRERNNVLTVEDPVEYTFEGISQIPINPRAGLTFGTAIKAILRQDPDIIMIGETRDLETSSLLVQAALTGHLVLSSLYTNTATDAMIRLKDIGVEPLFLVRETLIGITSQRLVRILCKECREKYIPEDITLRHFGLKKQEYYKAVGCKKCNYSGYTGRTGIFELFEPSPSTMELFLKGCNREELRNKAISEGMGTLFHDGIAKSAQGITTIEEVIRVTGGIV